MRKMKQLMKSAEDFLFMLLEKKELCAKVSRSLALKRLNEFVSCWNWVHIEDMRDATLLKINIKKPLRCLNKNEYSCIKGLHKSNLLTHASDVCGILQPKHGSYLKPPCK